MPELPEVETVARRLAPALVGKRIECVKIGWPRIVDRPTTKIFISNLIGKRILSVSRRGKYILIKLAPHGYLMVHLRMSGDLLVEPHSKPPTKHMHAVFSLDGGSELRFDDTRKFGRLYYVLETAEVLSKLGPEPIDTELTFEMFYQSLKQRRGAIKTLLLNQNFLAGIGNIYAVESLWRAKIHPCKSADKISKKSAMLLWRSIGDILNEAIAHSGTDIGDGVWKAGQYRTRVYGQEGRACSRCRTKIKKMVLSQRGTEYCSRCQKR